MWLRPSFSCVILTAFILSGCASSSHAPRSETGDAATRFAKGLAEIEPILQQATGPTGAVIIVFEPDGSIMHQVSTGQLTVNDPIYVASASKWLAAALLMTLVDEGLLDIDAPASRYAPYLTGAKAGISLRQMFSHTSGMNAGHAVEAAPSDSLQLFARELAELPLDSDPGTTFSYGGVSMQIAGAIMEEAAGQPFQRLFLERLASPLGMEHAYFCHPLNCNVDTFEDVTNPLIGGGLKISAADYGKFLQMIASGGEHNGRRILSGEAIAELSRVATVGLNRGDIPRVSRPDWEYALGQWCYEGEGTNCRVIQSVGAFGAYPWIDKKRGIFGIFLTESLIPEVYDDVVAIRSIIESAYDARLASLENNTN